MPALMMCAFQILLLPLLAGEVRLDRPLPVASRDYVMQYDDGTAYWSVFAGSYRGVWFDSDDFYGSGTADLLVNYLEFWFYHSSSYPWDTALFYAELWNGDNGGPVTQLDQTSVAAAHYAPCIADYPSVIWAEADIWALENASVMSAGGWPSILGDNTPQSASHSFYSDVFVWQPWIVGGDTANDFFIRAGAAPPGWALDEATWGAIKTLF
jgi:hypothetical protein